MALGHHAPHVLLGDPKVLQEYPLKLVAPVGALGNSLHAVEGQGEVAVSDLFAKRFGPPEVAVRKVFDFSHTQLLSADSRHKFLDVLLSLPIHAHELAKRVHVRVHGEIPFENDLPHPFAHLLQEPKTHADPRFAPRQEVGDVGKRQLVNGPQVVEEPSLLENAQRLGIRRPEHRQDRRSLVFAKRRIRDDSQTQLLRTSVALEPVEQDLLRLHVNALQRLLDAPLGDRGKQSAFESRILHPVALIALVNRRKLSHFWHHGSPSGGFSFR